MFRSRGASVYGESGNDTININIEHTFANGGDGADLFYLNKYNSYSSSNNTNFTNITITSGAGKDTIEFNPYYYYGRIELAVTDFSNDDVLRLDASYYEYTGNQHKVVTQSVQNGNVVISDNSSISTYNGNTVRGAIEPSFSITLQGVSDISQVANAHYYLYESDAPKEHKTLGELFGTSSSTSTTTPTENETTTNTTVTTPAGEVTTSTATTPANNTIGSGNNTTVVNNYYGDTYNVNDNNGTVLIGSSVTGDVTNNTSVDNSVTIIKVGNTYTYNGGNKTIESYQQGEVVDLASDYRGIDLKENNFYVKSSTGDLEIQNSRDKFIGYSAGGQMAAYSYVASGGGNVDGRNYDKAEIMIGGDNANNQIIAGNAGSSLWGGNGGLDTLVGGSGYNEFFYAVGGGDDVIQNANDNDLVNLASVNLSQISGVNVNIGQVTINFVDGGNLQVQGGSGVGYQIAEGTFQVNQSTGEWSNKG